MNTKAKVRLDLRPSTQPRKRICIYVTWKRLPIRYSTGCSITLTPEEFANPRLKVTMQAMAECRPVLSLAEEIIDALGCDFSFDEFSRRYNLALKRQAKGSDANKFVELIRQYVSIKEDILSESSKSLFRSAIGWALKYSPNTMIGDVNDSYVKGLIHFMKTEHLRHKEDKKDGKDKEAKPMSENTLRIYFRNYRAVYNYAIKEGLLPKDARNPFAQIQGQPLTSIKREKAALTQNELDAFLVYVPHDKKEEFAKDMFILSLQLCGCNTGDILSLRNGDIREGCIVFTRRKTCRTGIEITISYDDNIRHYFEKYGVLNPSKPSSYIFPFLIGHDTPKSKADRIHDVNKKINKGLKSISAHLGIRDFTTYNARHTYASFAQSQGMTAEQIQKFLGHSSSRTTEIYLGSITNSVVEKNDAVRNTFIDKSKV